MELAEKIKIKKQLFNLNFNLLLQGHFISKTGTFIFDIAMILWMKENTDNASLIGLILIAAHLPEIIIAPIGGVFSDIFSKKKIIVLSDLIAGILLISTGAFLYFSGSSINTNILVLFIVSMILGILNSVFNPAVSSFIPELVPQNKLQEANSLYNLAANSGKLIGQSASGFLFVVLGGPILFIFNGISFLISSLSELFIKEKLSSSIEKQSIRKNLSEFRKLVYEGFSFLTQNIALKRLIIVIALYHFFISPLPMLIPYYVSDTLSAGFESTGLLLALFTAGILAGFFFAKFFIMNKRRIKVILIASLIFSGLSFLILSFAVTVIISSLALFLIGNVIGILVVNIQTIIQTNTPNEMHGRIFGFFGTLINITFPLGYGIYGLMIDEVSNSYSAASAAPVIFLINGICLILCLSFIVKVDFRKLFVNHQPD